MRPDPDPPPGIDVWSRVAGALERASHFLHADRPELAEREMRDILREVPQDPDCHAQLGLAFLEQQRLDEAADEAAVALGVAPEHRAALFVLARVRAEQGRHREAEAVLLDGLRVDPNDPPLLVEYGRLLGKTEHLDKAERVLRRALALDPHNDTAHQMLAAVLQQGSSGRAARSHAATGLALDPSDASGHYILGMTMLAGGRPFTARRHLREALRIEPTDDDYETAYHQADKACRWVYWPYYCWSLIVDKLPGKQFAVWGLFVVFVTVSEALAVPDTVVVTIALCYVGFAVYTWFAEALVGLWRRLVPPR